MKINRITLLGILIISLLASCGSKKSPSVDSEDARFGKFRDYFIESLWRISPSEAIFSGNHKYDNVLIAPTAENRTKSLADYTSLGDSIKSFDEKKLSELNRIDLWMMKDKIEGSIWYINEFKSYEWNPSNYNVAGEFAEILNGSFDKLDARLKSFSIKLEQVPAYYAAAKMEIKKPSIEHTDLAILQIDGSTEEVFGKNLVDSINASTLTADEKNKIISLTDSAKKSIINFSTWLKETRKSLNETNSTSFRIRQNLYNKKFQYDIQSGYTADEIYKKAINRKAELHSEMAKISRGLWTKYFAKTPMPTDSLVLIRKVIDAISVNHVDRDSFLQSIEQQIPQLVKFINDKNLIYIDPSKPLVVRKTPAYMEGGGAGASISAPGPYDKTANTYYNVSPLTGYAAEQAESYLREYNHYILQILNIHEAIPGHYTQLVYSNQSPSLVKSILGNGAMVEGWAVYSERMMLENGYGNNEPEMWLMYYKWHLRSVCNTILDHEVHCNNLSENDAKKFLINGAFQQTAEAEGKWRRVKVTQVQLASYYTGFTEIYDLREEIKKIMGDKFDLKTFHEKFLSYGSAPVKYIRELMLADLKK